MLDLSTFGLLTSALNVLWFIGYLGLSLLVLTRRLANAAVSLRLLLGLLLKAFLIPASFILTRVTASFFHLDALFVSLFATGLLSFVGTVLLVLAGLEAGRRPIDDPVVSLQQFDPPQDSVASPERQPRIRYR